MIYILVGVSVALFIPLTILFYVAWNDRKEHGKDEGEAEAWKEGLHDLQKAKNISDAIDNMPDTDSLREKLNTRP